MENYVNVAYDKKEKPVTAYPDQLARYLYKRFHMKKGMRLLDNGCGRGDFLDAFEKCHLSVSGTDIVQGCDRTIILDLNNDRLPFDDNTFDVVFSKSVLEHIENTEHYMKEMQRVLKNGGVLILLVPDWETQYKIFYQDPTHIHPYTQLSVDRLLKMMGYQEVSSEKFMQLPSVWKTPLIGVISAALRIIVGPVRKVYKNKFIRFSCELMILGIGYKKDNV